MEHQCIDLRLKEIFTKPVFRKAPSIKDDPVRTYVPGSKPKTWLNKETLGGFKGDTCIHCECIILRRTFCDLRTQREYKTNGLFSWNSEHVVYRPPPVSLWGLWIWGQKESSHFLNTNMHYVHNED